MKRKSQHFNFKWRPNAHQSAALIMAIMVAGLGVYFLASGHAATPYASGEAESGTITSPATIISDSNASGGSAVQFGSNASSSCPSGEVEANDGSCVTLPSGTTKLVFDDEFNSTAVDSSLWKVADWHGDIGNNEPECYLPANTAESDGYLTETVKSQSVGNCPVGDGTTASASYTSGAVQMNTFDFTYGTIQARIKFAGGTGPWPALWLLGHNCQQPQWLPDPSSCAWPDPGSDEIDIAEILFSNHTSVNEQIHSSISSPTCGQSTTDTSTNWHTYGLTWSHGKLVYSIDGATCTTTSSAVPTDPMFLILNTAIGGAGGGISNGTLPQTTSVDYVRVFQ